MSRSFRKHTLNLCYPCCSPKADDINDVLNRTQIASAWPRFAAAMLRLSLSALPCIAFHISPQVSQVSLAPGWRVHMGLEVADLGLKNPKSFGVGLCNHCGQMSPGPLRSGVEPDRLWRSWGGTVTPEAKSCMQISSTQVWARRLHHSSGASSQFCRLMQG